MAATTTGSSPARTGIAGTEGAALHPAFAEVEDQVEIVHKGYGVPSYSALEGTVVATGEPVQDLVAGCDVDVVGLAYDFCVRATALGAREQGAPVRREAPAYPEGDRSVPAARSPR